MKRTGVYATREQLDNMKSAERLVTAAPESVRESSGAAMSRVVNAYAIEQGLPEYDGHWGCDLETGEFLGTDDAPDVDASEFHDRNESPVKQRRDDDDERVIGKDRVRRVTDLLTPLIESIDPELSPREQAYQFADAIEKADELAAMDTATTWARAGKTVVDELQEAGLVRPGAGILTPAAVGEMARQARETIDRLSARQINRCTAHGAYEAEGDCVFCDIDRRNEALREIVEAVHPDWSEDSVAELIADPGDAYKEVKAQLAVIRAMNSDDLDDAELGHLVIEAARIQPDQFVDPLEYWRTVVETVRKGGR
jgi:hypothetical protein